MTDTAPARRSILGDVLTVVPAALLSLLLSPIIVIWALVLGVPAALLGWSLTRRGSAGGRSMMLVAVGVLLGTVPYFVAAIVNAVA